MTRVLAVEDSPTQAERLREDLTAAGFAVTMARDGQEALACLETGQFDLMLTDIVMPGMDGYELCRTVKAMPAHALPVVLLTSLTDPLDVVKGLEAGADNFLRKPYRSEQLAERLRTTLRNRMLRDSSRVQVGVKLSFLDREFEITAERQQILDLLISTFEELVVSIRDVRAREVELTRLHAEVQSQLQVTQVERNRLRAVLDFVPVPVVVMDREGVITHLSRVGTEVFDTTLEELAHWTGTHVEQFLDIDGNPLAVTDLPLHRAAATGEAVEMGSAFDLLLARRDGSTVPVILNAAPVFDVEGRPAGSVATAHLLGTITELEPITGLPNRRTFGERLAAAVVAPHGSTAVLLLSLDDFEVASGTLVNHADGESILTTVARALSRAVDECSEADPDAVIMVASLGGGQFGFILSGSSGEIAALRVADCLRAALTTASEGAFGTTLTASIGAALAGQDADASALLTAAGVALRRARAVGGDRVELFDPAASQAALDRLALEADLREAIANGEIDLHYQSQVDLNSHEILGFEALARWQHKDRGSIPPGVFVEVAEESGSILDLGHYVLETACEQLRLWAAAGLLSESQSISVNLSAMQLRPELVGEVMDVLARTGVDPRQLMLEITETTAMKDPKATIAIIEQLKAIGVQFSLDDFGTGYSSLAYLSRIHFDVLKLDRTFVTGMVHNDADATIAQSVIALGHSLGVQVIAEGVEETDQVAVLQSYGCDQAQGYLFSRPLPQPDAERLLVSAAGR